MATTNIVPGDTGHHPIHPAVDAAQSRILAGPVHNHFIQNHPAGRLRYRLTVWLGATFIVALLAITDRLRPYQVEALDAGRAAWRRGVRRQLTVLPTGTGKTLIFSEIIRRRVGRALVLAHRDELLGQAADKIRRANPDAEVGVVRGDRDEVDAPAVVASVQTLARDRRLKRVEPDFTTIVVDEAHHAAAPSYRRVLAHLGAFDENGPLTLGYTATPERADGVGLGTIFQEVVFVRTLVEMIAAGYLCDLRAIQVRIDTDFAGVHVRAGDFIESETGAAMMAADAPRIVAQAWSQHAGGRRGLVFTPTVATTHAMATELSAAGLTAEALDGTTRADDRHAILARLRDGTTQVVSNCGVLCEGFDEPSISCIAICRRTRSQGLYLQMVGRGTRLHPEKSDCLILDLVGATTRHDLLTLASLAGVGPDVLADRNVADAVADAVATDAVPTGSWAGQLVSEHVELFRRRPLRWIQAGARYVICTGKGIVALEPQAGGTWAVFDEPRRSPPLIVARSLSLEFAQGVGEDLVRRHGALGLAFADARWLPHPATERQLDTLRRMQVGVPSGLTKGDASALITAKISRRAS